MDSLRPPARMLRAVGRPSYNEENGRTLLCIRAWFRPASLRDPYAWSKVFRVVRMRPLAAGSSIRTIQRKARLIPQWPLTDTSDGGGELFLYHMLYSPESIDPGLFLATNPIMPLVESTRLAVTIETV